MVMFFGLETINSNKTT